MVSSESAPPSWDDAVTNYFTKMELEAMEMMIAAEPKPIADNLREQLKNVTAVKVETTGVGFFKDLELSANAKPLLGKGSFVLRGVHALIDDREEQCAMFVFFVVDGFLRTLEGATPEEKWPETLEPYRLYYTKQV